MATEFDMTMPEEMARRVSRDLRETGAAFARAIAETHPSFVNIGADSKGTGLVEPTRDELMAFLNELAACGVPVRRKTNLGRLLGVSKAVDGGGVRVL